MLVMVTTVAWCAAWGDRPRSDGVVASFPERRNLADLHGRDEQRFVQQLIAQLTVEAFDLLRLAGHNIGMPGYGRLVRRSQRAQKCI
jgi:hypothetical protein